MQVRVQKWGNSLALRIPKSFAAQTRTKPDTLVEMSLEEGKITIVPVAQPKVSLAQLMEGVTPENLHEEV